METEHRYKRRNRSTEFGGMSSHDSPAKRSRRGPRQEESISSSSSRISLVRWKKLCIFVHYPYANTTRVLPHLLATVSLYYMPLHPRTYSLLYSISCLLDALDGTAARYFEQTTQFGAVMDMVTDRCTTLCPVKCYSQQARSPDGALSFRD